MENNEIWDIEFYERIDKVFKKYFKMYGDYEEIVIEIYLKLIKKKDLKDINDGYIYISLKNKLNDKLKFEGNHGNFEFSEIYENENLDVFGQKTEEEILEEENKINIILGSGSQEEKMMIRKIYDYYKEFDKITIKKICEKEGWNYDLIRQKINRFKQKNKNLIGKNIGEQFQIGF